ncbi:MAG TPA: PUA domain-containing protein [Nitrosopumilaceae archaeon]|nr:PUA domain-containing protein [Nitrosopumilaceae archaeon]
MKSNLISKSETAEVIKEISSQWKIDLPKIKNLKFHYLEDDILIITGTGLKAIKIKNIYIPFLSETEILKKFPYVMVDMGAVKFMCNGANVMRPGITKYSQFEKDQLVCIIEESQQKFLAIGQSCVPSSELESLSKGEIVKNMHYISDKYWESGKLIKD